MEGSRYFGRLVLVDLGSSIEGEMSNIHPTGMKPRFGEGGVTVCSSYEMNISLD